MALAGKGEKIGGATPNPENLNNWLNNHGGYVDSDLILWNSIESLGSMHLYSFTQHLTSAQIKAYVEKCYPVIVNVRDGTHWVLVTGYDTDNSGLFYVNDPGFTSTSYDLSGMSNFVVYAP